jgi:uncharacterized membrane protein (Fun14 family)
MMRVELTTSAMRMRRSSQLSYIPVPLIYYINMELDALTRQAIAHTRHCLTGCGIGEVLGMAIGQNLNNALQTALAVILAFVIGYGLTFRGAISKMSAKDALKLALAVDTISIISMEIIDNVSEWLIPGAINAQLHNILFWWSLALSLVIAFILTVPVNRFMISRGTSHEHHH